jgi:hypothetical protein
MTHKIIAFPREVFFTQVGCRLNNAANMLVKMQINTAIITTKLPESASIGIAAEPTLLTLIAVIINNTKKLITTEAAKTLANSDFREKFFRA